MKTMWKNAATVVAMLSVSSMARADLNQNGEVGLPLNPTAQIPNEGGMRVQANYYSGRLDDDTIVGGDDGPKSKYYGITAAGRVGDNIEISGGINRLDVDDNPYGGDLDYFDKYNKTGLSLGAKYLFKGDDDKSVNFAVGAGYNRALLNNVHVYGVASKAFGTREGRAPIMGHLGIRYDRFDNPDFSNNLPLDSNSSKASVFAGVEVPFTRNGDFAFVGEVGSKVARDNVNEAEEIYSAQIPFSASVRYRPAGQGFSGSLGIARNGIPGFGKSRLFAQLGYSFDTGQ